MHVICLAGAAFKSNIGLRKFWSQLAKFGHSCPNYINFQFLMKFCRYSILKAMILNHTFIFKIWAQIPKFGYFGPKIIDFLILTKFYLHPILKVLISNMIFVFKNVKPICQKRFQMKSEMKWNEMKRNQMSNLNKVILHLP